MYTAKILKILKIFDLLPFSSEHEIYSNNQANNNNNNNNNNVFLSKKAWPVGNDTSIMYKYYTTLQCYSGYLANDRLIFS